MSTEQPEQQKQPEQKGLIETFIEWLFHKHTYGEVKHGYQYCTECNHCIAAPKVKELPTCAHTFVIIDTYKVTDTRTKIWTSTLYVSRCTKCGILKKDNF